MACSGHASHTSLCGLLLTSASLPPSRIAVLDDTDRISVVVKDTLAAVALAVRLVMAALAEKLQVIPAVGNVRIVDVLRRKRRLVVHDEAPVFRRFADELLVLTSFADKMLTSRVRLGYPAPAPGFIK